MILCLHHYKKFPKRMIINSLYWKKIKEIVSVVFLLIPPCIQPKDLSEEDNIIMSVAPGKGKEPKSFYDNKFTEELRFPQLFPTGTYEC